MLASGTIERRHLGHMACTPRRSRGTIRKDVPPIDALPSETKSGDLMSIALYG